MKTPLSLGLIGVGGFGLFHRNAMALLRQEGRARLTAVADPTLERLPQLKQDLLAQGVRIYADYRLMLESEPDLAAVTIAAPIPFHEEMAHACLQFGPKIYLEKPPVPLIQQLDRLIVADAEERIHVGFQLLVSGWSTQIKQWVAEGRLGDILSIRAGACWPRTDAYYARAPWVGKMSYQGRPVFDGPASNALSHLIHSVMYLSNARESGFEEPIEIQGELYRARPMESYDTACARGLFRSGVEFTVAVTHATEAELPFQLRINGTKGWAQVSRDGRHLESSWGARDFTEETDALVNLSYRRYVDFVEGRCDRPLTRLVDTRGYVLATNGLLISSGGIQEMDSQWVRRYEGAGGAGYDVAGLYEAVSETIGTGRLFSEMNLEWAKSTAPISVEDLPSCALHETVKVRPQREPMPLTPA
ncbi:MAG: hypothetical protein B9S32_08185 [Verrucomicrobia bacterium Tous-C9LFEB]|nr:MAG: hypothetical protein B9S32_08185 [Verrucomicrobia bacterium Tous-C9LFEB]